MTKQKQFEQILKSEYNHKNFVTFLNELLTDIKLFAPELYNPVRDKFSYYVDGYYHIGYYSFEENQKILLLSVCLKKGKTVKSLRSVQKNFVKKLIENSNCLGALVAFYTKDESYKWRFSFIRLDYEFSKGNISEKLISAKRYSYLVGKGEPSATAIQMLFPIYENNFKKFSPSIYGEKITIDQLEEAFSVDKLTNEFFNKYKEKYFELKEYLDTNTDFKIAEKFAKKLLSQIIFLYFLQKKGLLGVANSEPWGTGSKDFMRKIYNDSVKKGKNFFDDYLEPLFYNGLNKYRGENAFYAPLSCRIPFLNDRLFEEFENYDWRNNNFNIPNEFFSNTDKKGLLDIFDCYNFTMNEDEPREREVAIDPEMLGKVFEKLLDVKDRKSKGAFYTPSEIIHYMCQETLINYLSTKSRISEEAIRNFILYGEDLRDEDTVKTKKIEGAKYPVIDKERYLLISDEIFSFKKNVNRLKELDNLLVNVKIADLAVGSGAFPVCILNEIVKIRSVLTDYLAIEMKEHQKREFIQANHRTNYDLKLETIKNCIFACDIDPNAVEIAKLRLGLSIVIDDDILTKEKQEGDERFNINSNPRPLPNLDCNIICGNSLVIPWKSFFPKVFKDNGGFDIVIGNPPYLQLQIMHEEADKLQNMGFKTFERTGDIYCLFYEKGYNLLSPNGFLCFITSNKWMKAVYGKSLRNFFVKNTNPVQLLDFVGSNIFENATVDVNILLLGKSENRRNTKVCLLDSNCRKNISLFFKHNNSNMDFKLDENWVILSPIEQEIKKKIESVGISLKDWDISIYRGILTGYNEAFIISSEKKDELIAEDPKSVEIIQPILRGRDIKRYVYDFPDMWLINTHNGIKSQNIPPVNIEKYPAIKKHLDNYYDNLVKRQDKGNTPYNLRNCVYMRDFYRQKIVYRQVSLEMNACIVENNIFVNDKCYFITGLHLIYLLSIFNSKLFNKIILRSANTTGGKGSNFLSKINIPLPNQNIEQEFIKLYNLRFSENSNYSSSQIDSCVDEIVYKLYDLTKEEIEYLKK